jgi:predicted site-specific integrase-resolvase
MGSTVVKSYSTIQVARMAGIGRMTLLRWLKAGKIPEPQRIQSAGIDARVWADRDVERLYKYKQENYRKGRGRKPKAKPNPK